MKNDGRLSANASSLIVSFIVYSLALIVGKNMIVAGDHIGPFWPAAGIGIWLLLRFENHAALSIFVSTLLFFKVPSDNQLALLFAATGNALEALAGAWLWRRCSNKKTLNQFAPGVATWTAAIVSPMIPTLIGAISFYLLGIQISDSRLHVAAHMWLGNTLAIALILSIYQAAIVEDFLMTIKNHKKYLISFPLFSCIWAIVLFVTFKYRLNLAILWAVIPCALFSVLCFGSLLSRIFVLFVTCILVYLCKHNFGPLDYGIDDFNLHYIKAFLFCVVSASMVGEVIHKEFMANHWAKGLLAIGWSIICWATMSLSNYEVNLISTDLNKSIDAAMESLKNTEEKYDLILKATAGIVANSPDIDQKTWKMITKHVNFDVDAQAVNGIGIISQVAPNQIHAFIKQQQSLHKGEQFEIHGIPGSTYKNNGDKVIIHIVEPLEKNRNAIGLEISSEANRHKAALLAQSTGKTTATEPIVLVQDHKKRPGFLILHPFERDANALKRGWTYAPVISENYFQAALNSSSKLFAIDVITSGKNVFRMGDPINPNGRFFTNRQIKIFDRDFDFSFNPHSDFFERHTSITIPFAFGLTAFFLITIVFLSEVVTFGARTKKIVDQRTDELKASHIQLMQASRLSSLGEMAGGIGHEINNPLAIIIGKTGIAQTALKKNPPDIAKASAAMDRVQVTCERIEKIVKGLKFIARDGEQDEMTSVKASSLIADTLELCQEKIKSKYVDLQVQVDAEVKILCRPQQIAQILINLISNSVDATDTLPTKWIRIETKTQENTVYFSVTDSGNGIPQQVLDRLMQPFFTTKAPGKGTGIGLSISQGIAEKHGGKLYYSPNEGHTRFILELPADVSEKRSVA